MRKCVVLILSLLPFAAFSNPAQILGTWGITVAHAQTSYCGVMDIFEVDEDAGEGVYLTFDAEILWTLDNNEQVARFVAGTIFDTEDILMTDVPFGDDSLPFFTYRGELLSAGYWRGPQPDGVNAQGQEPAGGWASVKLRPGQSVRCARRR